MTRIVVGALVLAVSLGLLTGLVWWWLAGTGRHRATFTPTSTPAPASAGALEDAPPPEAGRDAETVALRLAAHAGAAPCPGCQGLTTSHVFHGDGSRTCCRCSTITGGQP